MILSTGGTRGTVAVASALDDRRERFDRAAVKPVTTYGLPWYLASGQTGT
jgi:hypothetical protein